MSPKVGCQDEFERIYTESFRSLAAPYGEFVKYERDRAALDIGLHLTEKTNRTFRTVANSRVWFQLKGIRSTTVSSTDFDQSDEIPVRLKISDLKFWYASPEAVYLVVYIESKDMFLCQDIIDIVNRHWGESIFHKATFADSQEETTVRIPTSAMLDDLSWNYMLQHRSIRIDGPSFRGRPLGHRLDPLRCIPRVMDPTVFEELVLRLLSEHRFDESEILDSSILIPEDGSAGNSIRLSVGVLHHTFEWVPQLFTEFGYDSGSSFRIEGDIYYAHGPVGVLIHSSADSIPQRDSYLQFAHRLRDQYNLSRLLAFVNEDDPRFVGSYRMDFRDQEIECFPQLLGDLTFNILTSTVVYLDYRDKIAWRIINYLY